MTDELGFEEGAKCCRDGCGGTIALHPVENCSCHLNAPCGACTAPRLYCEACDWQEADEPIDYAINGYVVKVDPHTDTWLSWKRRELDPTKIDYHVKSHTNSSQICEGIYPEGTTQAEVRARVDGTFGGRFESFGGGKFKFIAYTD